MYDNTMLAVPPPSPFEQPPMRKQSKLGLASFIIGLVAFLLVCIGFIIAFSYGISLAANNPLTDPSMIDTSSPAILIASVMMCCSPGLSLLGIGLGIASVVQKTDKKTLGIIGLVINGLILISVCLLFGVGLIAQSGSLTL